MLRPTEKSILPDGRYARAVIAVIVCLSVSLFVCLLHIAGIGYGGLCPRDISSCGRFYRRCERNAFIEWKVSEVFDCSSQQEN